jgi:hypothetical protein
MIEQRAESALHLNETFSIHPLPFSTVRVISSVCVTFHQHVFIKLLFDSFDPRRSARLLAFATGFSVNKKTSMQTSEIINFVSSSSSLAPHAEAMDLLLSFCRRRSRCARETQ